MRWFGVCMVFCVSFVFGHHEVIDLWVLIRIGPTIGPPESAQLMWVLVMVLICVSARSSGSEIPPRSYGWENKNKHGGNHEKKRRMILFHGNQQLMVKRHIDLFLHEPWNVCRVYHEYTPCLPSMLSPQKQVHKAQSTTSQSTFRPFTVGRY